MKALTLTQPFATLVAIGAKGIETRSWRTNHRGPLAIHAGKGLGDLTVSQFIHLYHSTPFFEALAKAGYPNADSLPRGVIVCVTTVVACHPVNAVNVGWPERDFGDYSPGRFAWVLGQVTRFHNPVPCKGAQGLWDCEVDLPMVGV